VGKQRCKAGEILELKQLLTFDRLNVLTRRLDESNMKTSGLTTFNGSLELNVRHAYIMQHDCLIPSLTVRETLQYSAELRLRDTTSAEERNAIVEQTILELSLKECASTRIGTSAAKGCSGGEKRRTSIGIQVLEYFPTSYY
jgi:ABC-type multidrug transport system ATPase subunit